MGVDDVNVAGVTVMVDMVEELGSKVLTIVVLAPEIPTVSVSAAVVLATSYSFQYDIKLVGENFIEKVIMITILTANHTLPCALGKENQFIIFYLNSTYKNCRLHTHNDQETKTRQKVFKFHFPGDKHYTKFEIQLVF